MRDAFMSLAWPRGNPIRVKRTPPPGLTGAVQSAQPGLTARIASMCGDSPASLHPGVHDSQPPPPPFCLGLRLHRTLASFTGSVASEVSSSSLGLIRPYDEVVSQHAHHQGILHLARATTF